MYAVTGIRVSKAYTQMDEIDGNADLHPEDKQQHRNEVAAHALAEFVIACA